MKFFITATVYLFDDGDPERDGDPLDCFDGLRVEADCGAKIDLVQILQSVMDRTILAADERFTDASADQVDIRILCSLMHDGAVVHGPTECMISINCGADRRRCYAAAEEWADNVWSRLVQDAENTPTVEANEPDEQVSLGGHSRFDISVEPDDDDPFEDEDSYSSTFTGVCPNCGHGEFDFKDCRHNQMGEKIGEFYKCRGCGHDFEFDPNSGAADEDLFDAVMEGQETGDCDMCGRKWVLIAYIDDDGTVVCSRCAQREDEALGRFDVSAEPDDDDPFREDSEVVR